AWSHSVERPTAKERSAARDCSCPPPPGFVAPEDRPPAAHQCGCRPAWHKPRAISCRWSPPTCPSHLRWWPVSDFSPACPEPGSIGHLRGFHFYRGNGRRLHRLGDGKVGGRVGLNVVDGDIPDRETTLRLQNLGGELDAIEILVIGVIGDNRHIPQNRVGHH